MGARMMDTNTFGGWLARRAELVRAHTRGGALDRAGYRAAVAALLRR